MRFISKRNKWFYAECDWSILYISTYQQRRVFLSFGWFITKVSFMSRVMQVRKARHKASFLALQDSQKHSFLALGCGGCALTFAKIIFSCIWFSQLYMLSFNKRPLQRPKYPMMGLWLFCVPANRAHPKLDSLRKKRPSKDEEVSRSHEGLYVCFLFTSDL